MVTLNAGVTSTSSDQVVFAGCTEATVEPMAGALVPLISVSDQLDVEIPTFTVAGRGSPARCRTRWAEVTYRPAGTPLTMNFRYEAVPWSGSGLAISRVEVPVLVPLAGLP